MRRTTSPLVSFVALAIAACGGAGGKPAATANANETGDGTAAKSPSIGAIAAAQGGLAALGGAGNREEGGSNGPQVAMNGPLRAEEVDRKSPVKLDGLLREWPERAAVDQSATGATEGVAFGVGVQYDEANVYLAGEVTAKTIVRSSQHGEGDAHASMTLAFPGAAGQLKAYDIGFWPGKPGESSGVVKWLSGPNKGQVITGARLVEADGKDARDAKTLTFEASVPWATFPEARTVRIGLRAAFRYHHGDGTTVRGVLSTTASDTPAQLPALPTEAEQAIVDGLLAPQHLAEEAPKIDVVADLTGDDRKERISVFGKFFTICGPGYRGGHQYFWREVAGDIVALETRDVTGRGKDDVIVRRRVSTPSSVRETLEIWTIASGDEPAAAFSHEIAIASLDGKSRLTNAAHVSAKQLEISVEPAVGYDAASYHEVASSAADPLLLPWGGVKSEVFKFERGRFVKASEVPQAATATVTASRAPEAAATPSLARDVPTPPVRRSSDLSSQVLEAYLRDQGAAPGTKPRFDLEVHVDGDTRPERVLLIGRDIVVLGPGFKGGAGYARLSLTQFADEKDVTELTARDVTGDGAAELLVRGSRHVAPPGGGDRVDVDALFVYRVQGGSIARVFAIETGREQGGRRVQGLVQFVPAKRGSGFDIDVRPGAAKGWTAKSYTWPEDKPGGSLEPLLLPWGKTKSLHYAWNGSQFGLSGTDP